MYPQIVLRSTFTFRFNGLAICTTTVLFVADLVHTVHATLMRVNAWGTSGDRMSSSVIMRGSTIAGVVVDGAFCVSTNTAISLCGDTACPN